MSTALSPSSDTEPSRATESVGDPIAIDLVHLKDHFDLIAVEIHRVDVADIHAGQPHRRAGLEAGDIGETRFQV